LKKSLAKVNKKISKVKKHNANLNEKIKKLLDSYKLLVTGVLTTPKKNKKLMKKRIANIKKLGKKLMKIITMTIAKLTVHLAKMTNLRLKLSAGIQRVASKPKSVSKLNSSIKKIDSVISTLKKKGLRKQKMLKLYLLN